jgi:hypothetical protein
MADPVPRLRALSQELVRPLLVLLSNAVTDAATFDAKFTEIEGKLLEWHQAFDSVDKNNDAQISEALRVATLMLPLLGRVHQRSVELGASKGQKKMTAPAAGGFKFPRKMSRKYCKKTPCRKMGFTQRSSCRPYKNCFTRRARRSGY